MSEIKLETGLAGYLAKDAGVVESSLKEWGPEYKALSCLVDIFKHVAQLVVIKDTNLHIPAQLFLVVLNKSYGITSELLRRRTRDAQALARHPIEAAGIAYRIWKHPDLIQVYNEAYPKVTEDGNPAQFRPSNSYRTQFSAAKIFPEDTEAFRPLRGLYELFSVGATHAGLGALGPLKWKDGVSSLSERETDKVEIGRAWLSVIAAYWIILRIFFRVLKSTIPDGMSVAVEAEIKEWVQDHRVILKDRTHWIPDIEKGTL
jgi:hypothetical protein